MQARSRYPAVVAWASAVLLLSPEMVHAFGFPAPPPVLDPKTYVSPSGRFALHVDPSHMHGRGPATYRFTRDGLQVWSAEKPFSLWDARVTDDGVVGGYAYSEGYQGERDPGELRVVIVDGAGTVRLDHATKREGSGYENGSPNPAAAGIVMDAANDRLVIRVADPDWNRQAESWWAYRLSTGERLPTFRPYELMPDARREPSFFPEKTIAQAEPVAGTPLLLLCWWCYDRQQYERRGSRLTLIGPDGRPVLTLDLRGEARIAEGPRGDGRFSILDESAAERIEYSARRGAGGRWAVAELRRVRTPRPAGAASSGAIPDRPLRSLGRIELRTAALKPPSPIPHVRDFAFDGRGRIAVLDEGETSARLLLVDPSGRVAGALPLDATRHDDESLNFHFAGVGGDRFAVIKARYRNGRHAAQAWWADFGTGRVVAVAGFDRREVGYVAGFPDGGFVVGAWVCDDGLSSFDARGRRAWSRRADYNARPRDLLPSSPKAVAVTSTGEVAALVIHENLVFRFDRAGRHLGTIDLRKAWGREPHYPTGIEADRDGGLIIADFHGSPPIVRMGVDGSVRAQLQPKYADGRAVGGNVRAAPDGRLWTSDGYALLRLDDSGVVDRVLGDAPDPKRLGEITALQVDRAGRICAVDRRTGSVHVFDPQGRRLRVCAPDAGDYDGDVISPPITVSDDGDVYLGLGRSGIGRVGQYLHFAPDGTRRGVESLALDDITQDWHAQPGTGHRWVVAYHDVFLVDRAGTVVKTIERRPDRSWLERPDGAAVAPDGSIAVIARGTVNLYSASGEPLRMIPMPDPTKGLGSAYDGKHVAIVDGAQVDLFPLSGEAWQRSSLVERGRDDPYWDPYFAPGGRELLLFDGRTTITRHALPLP